MSAINNIDDQTDINTVSNTQSGNTNCISPNVQVYNARACKCGQSSGLGSLATPASMNPSNQLQSPKSNVSKCRTCCCSAGVSQQQGMPKPNRSGVCCFCQNKSNAEQVAKPLPVKKTPGMVEACTCCGPDAEKQSFKQQTTTNDNVSACVCTIGSTNSLPTMVNRPNSTPPSVYSRTKYDDKESGAKGASQGSVTAESNSSQNISACKCICEKRTIPEPQVIDTESSPRGCQCQCIGKNNNTKVQPNKPNTNNADVTPRYCLCKQFTGGLFCIPGSSVSLPEGSSIAKSTSTDNKCVCKCRGTGATDSDRNGNNNNKCSIMSTINYLTQSANTESRPTQCSEHEQWTTTKQHRPDPPIHCHTASSLVQPLNTHYKNLLGCYLTASGRLQGLCGGMQNQCNCPPGQCKETCTKFQQQQQMASMQPSQMASMPPNQMASMPPSQMASVPPSQMASMPPSQMASMPPSQMASMPPSQMASMQPSNYTGQPPMPQPGVQNPCVCATPDCTRRGAPIQTIPPGSVPGTVPGSVPGSMPGTVPGSMPGTVPGTVPGTLPGSRPGSAPGIMPGTVPGTVPGSMPGTVPGTGPGSTTGPPPGSMPGTVPGTAPGTVPGSGPQSQHIVQGPPVSTCTCPEATICKPKCQEKKQAARLYAQQVAAVPGTQPPTVPGSQYSTVPGSQQPTVPGSQQPTVPGSQQPTVPGSQLPTVPGSQYATAPGTQPQSIMGQPSQPGVPDPCYCPAKFCHPACKDPNLQAMNPSNCADGQPPVQGMQGIPSNLPSNIGDPCVCPPNDCKIGDTVPGSMPGTVPGSMPGTVPGTVPGSMPGTVPGTMPGSMPGSRRPSTGKDPCICPPSGCTDPGSTLPTIPGSMPGTVPASMPGTVPGSMPGTVPGSMPGTVPGSMPGTVPGSMPGTVPGSMPGTVPGSVPAMIPGSMPGTVPGSMPGVAPGMYQGMPGLCMNINGVCGPYDQGQGAPVGMVDGQPNIGCIQSSKLCSTPPTVGPQLTGSMQPSAQGSMPPAQMPVQGSFVPSAYGVNQPQGDPNAQCKCTIKCLKATCEMKKQAAYQQGGQMPPGTVPGSMPGTVPGTMPGTVPGSMPGTAPGTMPGTVPGSMPGTVPGSMPGTVPGSMPGTVPGSMPGTVPGTMPGTVPGTQPGSVMASNPAQMGGPPGGIPGQSNIIPSNLEYLTDDELKDLLKGVPQSNCKCVGPCNPQCDRIKELRRGLGNSNKYSVVGTNANPIDSGSQVDPNKPCSCATPDCKRM